MCQFELVIWLQHSCIPDLEDAGACVTLLTLVVVELLKQARCCQNPHNNARCTRPAISVRSFFTVDNIEIEVKLFTCRVAHHATVPERPREADHGWGSLCFRALGFSIPGMSLEEMPAHLESLFTTDLDNLRQDFRPVVFSRTGVRMFAASVLA